jgi:hypothetical protein
MLAKTIGRNRIKKCRDKRVIWIAMLLIVLYLPSIAPATEEDPLKDMKLDFPTTESLENRAKFLSIGGYLESRDQVRVKEMDEPISLRQRLWVDCYLGQDWMKFTMWS